MDLLARLGTECGILTMSMAIVIVWLAMQLQQERKGREADRKTAIEIIDKYRQSHDSIIRAHEKLEELRFARGGNDD